ncbi:MAG: hypothetical protein AABX31_04365 [Nanoarchaeota archaeon]
MKKQIVLGLAALLLNCDTQSLKQPTTPEAKLAQCLAQEGATMYGAYWCKWCTKQKGEFGPGAWEYFKSNYVECSEKSSEQERQRCKSAAVSMFPYWTFKDGKTVAGYIPLKSLAEISGCDQ